MHAIEPIQVRMMPVGTAHCPENINDVAFGEIYFCGYFRDGFWDLVIDYSSLNAVSPWREHWWRNAQIEIGFPAI